MTTGEKIKKRRLELGITQKDVAKMIGATGAYVSAVEKQKRNVNKETRLVKFAEALECSVNDLKPDAPKNMIDPTNDDFGAVCNCAVRSISCESQYFATGKEFQRHSQIVCC